MSGAILITLTLAAIGVAGWRLAARVGLLVAARSSHRTDHIARRLTGALEEVLTQRWLLQRQP